MCVCVFLFVFLFKTDIMASNGKKMVITPAAGLFTTVCVNGPKKWVSCPGLKDDGNKCGAQLWLNMIKKDTSPHRGKDFISCWTDKGGCGYYAVIVEHNYSENEIISVEEGMWHAAMRKNRTTSTVSGTPIKLNDLDCHDIICRLEGLEEKVTQLFNIVSPTDPRKRPGI